MTFERACALSDLADGEVLAVTVGEAEIALARYDGEVYALTDLCSHSDYPLSDGGEVELVDGVPTVECTWHGSCFDLRTGAPTNLPATELVATHPVRVEGDDVLVDTAPAPN